MPAAVRKPARVVAGLNDDEIAVLNCEISGIKIASIRAVEDERPAG